MRAGFLSVDPDAAAVINGTEVQKDTLPLPVIRQRERTPIPACGDKVSKAHTGKPALRTERNTDCALQVLRLGKPAFFTGIGKVQFKFPCAIQQHP